MKKLALMMSLVLVSVPAFALTLFNDLNMAGNRITNVTEIRGTAGNPLRLQNVAQVQFANGQVMTNIPAGDIRYPDGRGISNVWFWINSSTWFTVPVARTLYVVHLQSEGSGQSLEAMTNGGSWRLVWTLSSSYSHQGFQQHNFITPMPFAARTVLRGTSSSRLIVMGFLTPEGVNVLQISLNWGSASRNYIVPAGRRLVVMTGVTLTSSDWLYANIGGTEYSVWLFGDQWKPYGFRSVEFPSPLVFPAGTQLRNNTSSDLNLTGYLE